jgi:ferritin-like protein
MGGDIGATVAREIVVKAGVKVDELTDVLVRNEVGMPPEHMKVFHAITACQPARPPKDPTDIKAMSTILLNAERCAVAGYSHVRNIAAGKDRRTHEFSIAILNEKAEHESWLSEFLEEETSGHCMRQGDPSTFVSKFQK